MRRLVSGITVAVLGTLWTPAPSAAQVNAESFARLGFNFNPPGARSAAMGGAFIPIADDATAAESNPAGLTVLVEAQLSFEFKGVRYSRYLEPEAGGSAGTGSTFEDERGFPSFASAVVPFGSWIVGGFRHELVNYRNTVWSNGSAVRRLLPFTSVLDLRVENWGLAVAREVGSQVSLGVSAGLSRLDMAMDFPRYGASLFEQRFVQSRLDVNHQASSYFVNAGIIWRPNTRVYLGGVYKRRPAFSGLEYRLANALDETIRTVDGTLKVPDAFGGGISVRVTELFTLSLDAVVNLYSQLADEQTIAYVGDELLEEDYRADNGTDLHLGGEYVMFLGQAPLSLRAGIARLAPSNVYYVGLNRVERDLWGTRPADRTFQSSVGLGVVLFDRVQLESAGVFGEHREEFVASLVYLFR